MAKIDKLKSQLAGGKLSQQEAEAVANQIRSLGGKVQLGNFGYTGGAKAAAPAPAQSGGPGSKQPVPTDPSVDPRPNTAKVSGLIEKAKPIKKPESVYTADVAGELDETQKQTLFQNPNYTNPFGQQTTTLNDDGTVSVDQTLDPAQQKIVDQDAGLSSTGRGIAEGQLASGNFDKPWEAQTADRQFQGGFSDDRRRIEDAVYGNLTRNFDRDQSAAKTSAEQQIKAKGIPFSADPKSRYQTEFRNIQENFDDRRDKAGLYATQYGGDELARQFAQQEQLIANQYAQDQGQRQQQVSDATTFANFGTGARLPNFQAYQAGQYDVQDPSAYIYAGKGLKTTNEDQAFREKQLEQQTALANKQLGLQEKQLAQSNAGAPAAAPSFP